MGEGNIIRNRPKLWLMRGMVLREGERGKQSRVCSTALVTTNSLQVQTMLFGKLTSGERGGFHTCQ